MNRSFRAKESQMHAAFRNRQQQLGDLRSSMIVNDKDEELALFLEMKNRENECNDLLFADAPLGSNQENSPLFNVSPSATAPVRKAGADDFLNSENDKNDYDWLLTPPGTPLFPSLEMETQKTIMSQLGASTTRPIASKSRLANPPPEHTGRSSLVSKQSPSSPRLNSSGGGIRKLSSPANPGSTPATPTRQSTLTTSSKSSRTSTPTLTTSSKSSRPSTPTLTTSSKSSRPSTPTSHTSIPSTRTMGATTKATVSATKNSVPIIKTTTVPAAKLTVPSRSSTPLSRSTARSSTPTSRPTLSASRPTTSRASTPTRRPSTPSNPATTSTSSVKTSSISKPAPVVSKQLISKQSVPSLGTSTMRSRPWKPSEMPGFSHDAPPNLRTTLPERPLLATRGRPGVPTARSSSIEPAASGRPKRQSCSPSRGRSSIGISHTSGSSMPAVNRGHSKVNDNVNPVAMGTKMVERVINMRKLAPPTLDYKNSPRSNLFAKSSSNLDSSGFGRTLSKKSLDMAIRHMDIRQRAPGNLRPLMTNIPASSTNSVRSRHQRSRTVSVSGSPHATSSNASSEVSVNLNGLCLDNSGIDDDLMNERGVQYSASSRGR